MLRSFAIAVQFLTRFPVRFTQAPSEQEIGASLMFYPLVGLLLGVLLQATILLCSDLPDLLSAAIACAVWIVVTGALHLDGLADSADAWLGGYGSAEKTLAIMKDPACGPAGVVSIVTQLMLKFSALYAIIKLQALVWLFIAPSLARLAVVALIRFTPYVRKNGLGSLIVENAQWPATYCVSFGLLALVWYVVGSHIVLLLLPLVLVFIYVRHSMMQRIGGMTGDLAGALIEITETVLLISICFVYPTIE